MLNLQLDKRLRLEEHGPEIVFIKGIHNTIADQPHGLGMTPVSIEQLRATLRQKSTKTQKAVRDKTGWQSQILWCKLKVNTIGMKIVILCLQTTEKRMEYTL
jgi:hypothetical protein